MIRSTLSSLVFSAMLGLCPVAAIPGQDGPGSPRSVSRCSAGVAGPDSIAAALIDATNRGTFDAIDGAVARFWNLDRLPFNGRQTIRTMLARWHWVSGQLDQVRVCAISPTAAYAVAQNRISGEIDSLVVGLSPFGKIVRMQPIEGASIPIAPTDTSSDENRARAIDQLVRRMADNGVFAGEVVFAKNGRVLYHRAVGVADRTTGRKVREGEQFSIASTGKLITGTAIMRLVEDKRLSLDDTLGKFLGPSERPRDAGGVELKYILSHTDGMERGSDTLSFRPGTRFAYVNYGYYLLGRVVEVVTGKPFADYYASAIFRPAGMTMTRQLQRSEPDPALAPGYVFVFDSAGSRFEVNPLLQTTPATGAGGLFSTAMDLFRFTESLRTGKLISRSALATMRAPRKEWGATDYGFGVDWYRGNNIWGHTGFIPGTNADVELYGDSGYVLVMLGNTGTNDPIRRRVGALVGKRPLCQEFAAGVC